MKSWRARLLAVLAISAMLLAVSGPAAMAQNLDDCEFVGFDSAGNPLYVCDDFLLGNELSFDENLLLADFGFLPFWTGVDDAELFCEDVERERIDGDRVWECEDPFFVTDFEI